MAQTPPKPHPCFVLIVEFLSKLNNEKSGCDTGTPTKEKGDERDGTRQEEGGGDGGHGQAETAIKYTNEQMELVQRSDLIVNCISVL